MNGITQMPRGRARLDSLDALRGLAALWVALYHFTQNHGVSGGFPADGMVRQAGFWGYLGVDVFFVISGFIIPWTLGKGGYGLRDYGRFLWKRVLRLHPLYLVSLAIITVSTPGFVWERWWPHLFFLNDAAGVPWLLQIYWTLALEMQYYLFIGLAAPLLMSGRESIRLPAMAAWACSGILFPAPQWLWHYAALFAMGMTVCHWMRRRPAWWLIAVELAVGAVLVRYTLGTSHAVTAAATAGLIVGGVSFGRAGAWLGAVSYPFYLTHLTAGGLVTVFFAGLERNVWRDTLGVLAALILSLAAAWVLHRWVELPCQRWSSAVRYRAGRR